MPPVVVNYQLCAVVDTVMHRLVICTGTYGSRGLDSVAIIFTHTVKFCFVFVSINCRGLIKKTAISLVLNAVN